ncbi:MAG: hypothetical protein IPF48_10670 [Sphingomonadales bacterium]|nr:hypothetical protein [Sphingomonadales bacterium]
MAVQTLGRSGFQASGRHSLFFPIASLFLLFLTIAGFWDNLFTDVGQPSNSDPKFIVHGLFCGSWMIALLAQSLLVNRGNVRLHRKLGMFALVAAIGVALSTIWVFPLPAGAGTAQALHVYGHALHARADIGPGL